MEIDEFITLIGDKLYQKNTWAKSGHALQESVMETIKGQLLKKNLVLVHKTEYEDLKTRVG